MLGKQLKYFAAFVIAVIIALLSGSVGAYAFVTVGALLLPAFIASMASSIMLVICAIICIVSIVAASYFKERIRDAKSQRKSQKDLVFRVDATA
jgi:uncharacterized membrane protein